MYHDFLKGILLIWKNNCLLLSNTLLEMTNIYINETGWLIIDRIYQNSKVEVVLMSRNEISNSNCFGFYNASIS